jgi:pSer/pThr/pTyr-binding forkhead associated (FHA) protein
MKVQLVVVRGKPEGKVIPLVGPKFKIGRGETCHLRPISEQISREHAEFTIDAGAVVVRDLGSRNGTLVNGKALTDACQLKDRDLVQVGPLTFAVSIVDPPAAAVAASPRPAATPTAETKASPDDISTDDIDSWLIGPNAGAAADQPTAVYGGDTITISAFKDAAASPKPAPTPPAPASASDDEYERQPEDGEGEIQDYSEEDSEEEAFDDDDTLAEDESSEGEDVPEEFLDESNPFYAAKKALKEQAKQTGPAKPSFKDTSDAATDILRRLMERRRSGGDK